MKRISNKGFTLVELIATLVILALVMGIGAFSITKIINNSKEKEYELLIKEIKKAVELYYQECTYSKDNLIECPTLTGDNYYEVKLRDLVKYGYLKGNSTVKEEGSDKDSIILVNPKENNNKIMDCSIKYEYESGKITIQANGQNDTSSCPTTDDYEN